MPSHLSCSSRVSGQTTTKDCRPSAHETHHQATLETQGQRLVQAARHQPLVTGNNLKGFSQPHNCWHGATTMLTKNHHPRPKRLRLTQEKVGEALTQLILAQHEHLFIHLFIHLFLLFPTFSYFFIHLFIHCFIHFFLRFPERLQGSVIWASTFFPQTALAVEGFLLRL